MSQDNSQENSAPRSGRVIAQQAANEHDPNRVLQLAHELIETLDAASNRRIDGISASDKAKGAD